MINNAFLIITIEMGFKLLSTIDVNNIFHYSSVDFRRYLKRLKNFQFPLFNILFENKSGLDRYLGKVIQPFLQ